MITCWKRPLSLLSLRRQTYDEQLSERGLKQETEIGEMKGWEIRAIRKQQGKSEQFFIKGYKIAAGDLKGTGRAATRCRPLFPPSPANGPKRDRKRLDRPTERKGLVPSRRTANNGTQLFPYTPSLLET